MNYKFPTNILFPYFLTIIERPAFPNKNTPLAIDRICDVYPLPESLGELIPGQSYVVPAYVECILNHIGYMLPPCSYKLGTTREYEEDSYAGRQFLVKAGAFLTVVGRGIAGMSYRGKGMPVLLGSNIWELYELKSIDCLR